MTTRADKFRQAAISYVGLGATVIILTLVAGTSPQRGVPPLTLLLVGVVFVAAFGVILYAYAWLTRRWLQRGIAVLAGILVATNALRALQYFINFLGYRLELNFKPFGIAIHPSVFHFPVLFLICALLMAGITYMLARAAWDL